MLDLPRFALFLAASLTLIMIPGPAVLYIVAQSLGRGPRFGIASSAGVAAGGLVHVAAAVLGLSALLAASPTAFSAVKYLGAAYLVYLGISKIREQHTPLSQTAHQTPAAAFRQGMVVQILNPKVALFFLSFLPQFLQPGTEGFALQVAGLGLTFVVLAFLSDSFYALLASKLGFLLHGSGRAARWIPGLLFVALGLFAALSR